MNGSAFGLTIFISLLGACGSGKLKLGAGAWLISGSSTVGAFGGVKSKEIGFFCILFGLIAALISIVTRGSCFCSVLPNPYPEPKPFLALEEAEIKPEDVAYVNAHGTSTPANEKGESGAIVSVLGKDVPVSSTKSFTGHLLGAAGAVEAIATIEAMRHSFVPKTAGTQELSDYIEANVIFGQGKEQEIPYAISNTFGFGGHNAVLAFKRWEA